MTFIDVFNNKTANMCMNKLMTGFLLHQKYFFMHYDGLYLRENEPFTISNGTDLNITHYMMKPENKTEIKKEPQSKWNLGYQ